MNGMGETAEVIGACTEAAKVADKVLPKTVSGLDDVVASIVDVFSLMLYPVKKANLFYKYKLKEFAMDLQAKIAERKIVNFKMPGLEVLGPVLEAMRYTIDNVDLRKLYLNLLVSSVDADSPDLAHPSYVDVIKRMNGYDARLFQYLLSERGYIEAANPKVHICNSNRIVLNATPEWYINAEEFQKDAFRTSASLVRIAGAGLIDLMYDHSAGGSYDWVASSAILKKILDDRQRVKIDKLELTYTKSVIVVNDNGRQFAKACGISVWW